MPEAKELRVPNISIVKKGLLLVLVPLGFEIAAVLMLQEAVMQADGAAREAIKQAEISDCTNSLIKELYTLITTNKLGDLVKEGNVGEFRIVERAKVEKELNRLKELTVENSKQRQVIADTETAYKQASKEIETGVQAFAAGDLERFSYIKKHLGRYARAMVSPELLELNNEVREESRAAAQAQSEKNSAVKVLINVLLFSSVTFSLLLAYLVTNSLTKRLARLAEKASAVARGEALGGPIEGTDEIAKVDRVFTNMVETLEEANYRERAILENARDLICSISKEGKFTAVSKAAFNLFGIEAQDLQGRFFTDLMPEADIKRVSNALENTRNSSAQFEVQMYRADGKLIDVLWSVHWSSEEGALFCVIHDITERKDAERLRQEVVKMVTHDLRTPLTAVRHVLEMLDSGMSGKLDQEAKKLVERADKASARMSLLINDLLDIEKIRAGQLKLQKAQIMTGELFDLALDTVLALSQQKQIEIRLQGQLEIEVSADPDRIAQVLVNLIGNAIKFSPEKSTIVLEAEATGQFVKIRVKDQGRGIPREKLQEIFKEFAQVEERDAREKGGSGLGLTICKALVELHGGSIWAENNANNEVGTSFIFTLPANS